VVLIFQAAAKKRIRLKFDAGYYAQGHDYQVCLDFCPDDLRALAKLFKDIPKHATELTLAPKKIPNFVGLMRAMTRCHLQRSAKRFTYKPNESCSMPADALILLSSRRVRKKFRRLAGEKGERKWGYARVVDLRKTDSKLPVILYCGGYRNGMNTIQFIAVADLGLTRVQEIAAEIFGDIGEVRIFGSDWRIDIDIPLLPTAASMATTI
jgi:hypothetical protein